jgi:NitT/TauT family transport system substrate-binding protein
MRAKPVRMNDRAAGFSRPAFLAGLPAIALAASSRGTARAADNVSLQVGVAPADATGQIFYAEDRAMFKAAGIDVTLNILQNSATMASAVASGAVDIAASSVAVVANASQRGLALRFIGTGCLYTTAAAPTSEMVVAKDSPIRSAADLNGKFVAVNGLKDITQITGQAWLDKNGADLSSIKFVEMPFGTMQAALAEGRVSAAVLAYPYLGRAKDYIRILGNSEGALADRFLVMGWISTDTWLQKNPDLAKRVVGVLAASATWANGHPKESAQILGTYMKVSSEQIEAMPRALYDDHTRLSTSLVQPVIEAAVKYGAVGHTMPAANLIWQGGNA